MVHAWHVALFSRQEKLPSLDRVLTSMHGKRPQTVQQQRTVMDMLSAKLGVPVKRARFIRKDAA